MSEWVAGVARWAVAHGSVVISSAFSAHRTSGRGANFNAHAVHAVTRLIVGTVVVGAAADGDTGRHWVSLHAHGTVALGSVHQGATLGVDAASWATVAAWIYAVLVDASHFRQTLGVLGAVCCVHGENVNDHPYLTEKGPKRR